MPDLHAWIGQQIDEVERLARRAAELCGCHPPAPSWSFRDGDEPGDGRILVVDEPHPSLKRKIGRRWNGSYEGLSMAEHVVRHDPEAVLRRCAVDRRILELHAGDHECSIYDQTSPGDIDHYAYVLESETCDTVRLLAEAYGWKEETDA